MTALVGGLDPSLRATGLATPDGDLFTVKTGKLRGPARLAFIRDGVMEALSDAEVVVIEGYSFNSRGRSVFNIGELGGVLRLAFYEAEIDVVEVPPASLKKHATGKGNASKEEMIQAARAKGANPQDDNQADAWHLRQWGLGL